MKDKLEIDRNHPDFVPTCAEDCGMEEAFGLGFLNDPTPPLPHDEEEPTELQSRSDVTKQDFTPG